LKDGQARLTSSAVDLSLELSQQTVRPRLREASCA